MRFRRGTEKRASEYREIGGDAVCVGLRTAPRALSGALLRHTVRLCRYEILFMWLPDYCTWLPHTVSVLQSVDAASTDYRMVAHLTAKAFAVDTQIRDPLRELSDIVFLDLCILCCIALTSPSTPTAPRLNLTPTKSPVQTRSRFGRRSTQDVLNSPLIGTMKIKKQQRKHGTRM